MDHFSAKLALIGACALAGTSVGATYTETFDTDAIDNAAVTAAYPDFTLTGTHSVESGVANIAGDGGRMVVSAAAIGAGSDFGMTTPFPARSAPTAVRLYPTRPPS